MYLPGRQDRELRVELLLEPDDLPQARVEAEGIDIGEVGEQASEPRRDAMRTGCRRVAVARHEA